MNEQEAPELTGRRRELLEALPALRRFALSLTGNLDAADELLQAAVARVLKRGLPIEAELAPWCVRVCRDVWSDQGRVRETLANGAGADGVSQPEAVQAALAGLPGEQRAVLELVALEGHSYHATAAMLDLPIGRVMSRLARARGALIDHCDYWTPAWQAPPARKAVNHD